jgi:hypothetical protein
MQRSGSCKTQSVNSGRWLPDLLLISKVTPPPSHVGAPRLNPPEIPGSDREPLAGDVARSLLSSSFPAAHVSGGQPTKAHISADSRSYISKCQLRRRT